jgi:hypothetical protein
MQALVTLFGEGKDLSAFQMGMRAGATFVAALVLMFVQN